MQWSYDTFSRNFHTMPSTTNPNDQRAFAEFCYGNMKSCKEGDCYDLITSCEENNYLCKPSYANDDDNEKVIDDSGEQSREVVLILQH